MTTPELIKRVVRSFNQHKEDHPLDSMFRDQTLESVVSWSAYQALELRSADEVQHRCGLCGNKPIYSCGVDLLDEIAELTEKNANSDLISERNSSLEIENHILQTKIKKLEKMIFQWQQAAMDLEKRVPK